MQKKILIAVDGSIHARNGLLYAAGLYAAGSDLRFGLIHVQSIVSRYFLEEAEGDPRVKESLYRAVEQNRLQSSDILEKSRQLLMSRGVPDQSIDIISKPRQLGVTKDIIEYAHEHLYEAIVAGRRGLTRMQKIFMGSISAKLVQHSSEVPVWIIDGEISPEKILVVVDVAGSWRRMLDHLGRICAGIDHLRLTFYYVRYGHGLETLELSALNEINARIAEKEQSMIERFWDEAVRTLTQVGLQESRIDLSTPVQTAPIGKMILNQIESGMYDTVVIGRRGSNRSFFSGGVSRFVIERLTDHAIWISE
jgi:nucleotide-binding universal stress UspA family protein